MAIPLIALGGMYLYSNKNIEDVSNDTKSGSEGFVSNGKTTTVSYDEPPENFPVSNNEVSTIQNYPNANQATDKYFSKNVNTDKEINKTKSTKKQQYYSMTGSTIDSENFKHNNMVPYFGSKIRGQSNNLNGNEQVLDFMTGSGSQQINKSEQAPLFKPEENLDFAYGAPNQSDFYQSRVNASNRMANVKPWEEERVAPGLNQGFTTGGGNGFNSALDARDLFTPKNVDQLRVETNPKQSYSLKNHQGPAVSSIKNVTTVDALGKFEKNLPDTYYENTLHDMKSGKGMGFTTTGLEQRPTARGSHVDFNSHRGTQEHMYEGISTANNKETYAPTVYEPSRRCEPQTTQLMNLSKIGSQDATSNDYGRNNAYTSSKNNRSCTPSYDSYGGIKGAIGAVISPIMDILRPSRKEEILGNVCGNAHTFGEATAPVASMYFKNPYDKLQVTNREMDSSSLGHMNVQNQHMASLNIAEHQLPGQQRESTQCDYTGIGGGSGANVGQRSYGAEYNQINNGIKNQTIINRTNAGNTQIHNPHVNVSVAKREEDILNNRGWAPASSAVYLPPSQQTYGHLDMPQQTTNDDSRMDDSLLEAFKSNPYTQSLKSIA